MIWSSKCSECVICLLLYFFSLPDEITTLLFMSVCKGFAGGAGETGEQSQKVWCCDTPTTKRMSPLSVWFSQQHTERCQCKVIFISTAKLYLWSQSTSQIQVTILFVHLHNLFFIFLHWCLYFNADGLVYWKRLSSVSEAARPCFSCGSVIKTFMSRTAATSSFRRKWQTSSSNLHAARILLMTNCLTGWKNAV